MEHFTLSAGTTVHIAGLPVQLVHTAMVRTHEETAKLIKMALTGSSSITIDQVDNQAQS